jgi:hypothetical protein
MPCLVVETGCGFEALHRMFAAVRIEGCSFVVELALRMSMLMLRRCLSFRWRPVRLGMRHIAVAGHRFGLAPRFGSGTSTPTTGTVAGAAVAAVADVGGFVSLTTV